MSTDDLSNETKGLLKDEGLTELQLDDEENEVYDMNLENKNKVNVDEDDSPSGPRSTAFDRTENLEEQAEIVIQILVPVCITLFFVIAILKVASFGASYQISPVLVYRERASDSGSKKFFGSVLNALIFVGVMVVVTFLFVFLYKYRCMKILYGWLILSTVVLMGGGFGILLQQLIAQTNTTFDWITLALLVWNFAVVGFIATFWHAPVKINQFYMIAVSVIMACIFTRLPEWTTWAILIALAIYDLAAVLCPKGPLRLLVETAQERNEPIPALVYNASIWMAMAQEEEISNEKDEKEEEEEDERRGVKLGLGDFVFYSVLVGRASLFDMLTVFTCSIAVITGLFFTIILLALWKRALPALPISIALGFIYFFTSKIFLLPFASAVGQNSVVM